MNFWQYTYAAVMKLKPFSVNSVIWKQNNRGYWNIIYNQYMKNILPSSLEFLCILILVLVTESLSQFWHWKVFHSWMEVKLTQSMFNSLERYFPSNQRLKLRFLLLHVHPGHITEQRLYVRPAWPRDQERGQEVGLEQEVHHVSWHLQDVIEDHNGGCQQTRCTLIFMSQHSCKH